MSPRAHLRLWMLAVAVLGVAAGLNTLPDTGVAGPGAAWGIGVQLVGVVMVVGLLSMHVPGRVRLRVNTSVALIGLLAAGLGPPGAGWAMRLAIGVGAALLAACSALVRTADGGRLSPWWAAPVLLGPGVWVVVARVDGRLPVHAAAVAAVLGVIAGWGLLVLDQCRPSATARRAGLAVWSMATASCGWAALATYG